MHHSPKFFLSIVEWLQDTLKSNNDAVSSFVALRDKERGDEVYREWIAQMLESYQVPDGLSNVKIPAPQLAKKAVRKVAMELSSTLPLIAATYIHLENIQHTDIAAWMKDEADQDANNKDRRGNKPKSAIHERDHVVVVAELPIHSRPDVNSDVVGKLVSGQWFFSQNPHITSGDQTWAEIRNGYILMADGSNRNTASSHKTKNVFDCDKNSPEYAARTEEVINWIQNYINNAPNGTVTAARLGGVLGSGFYSKIVKSHGGCRALISSYQNRLINAGNNVELGPAEIPPMVAVFDTPEGKVPRNEERKQPRSAPVHEQPLPDMGPILADEDFNSHDPITGAIPQPPTQPSAQATLSDLLDVDINDITNRPVQPPPSMNPIPQPANGGRRERKPRVCNNWTGVRGSCRFGDDCAYPHPNGGQPPPTPQQPQQQHQPHPQHMRPIQVPHGGGAAQPILIHPIPPAQPGRVPVGLQPMPMMPPQNLQGLPPPISPEEMRSRQILDTLIGAQRERKRQLAALGNNAAGGGPLKRHAPVGGPILP